MTWASRIVPACEELAAALTAAGVPATLSRASLKVPGAWVRPDLGRAVEQTLAGPVYVARVSVLLVAPEGGDAEALADLCGLLDLALDVITPDEDVDTSVVLPLNNNRLPAFRLVVDLDL